MFSELSEDIDPDINFLDQNFNSILVNSKYYSTQDFKVLNESKKSEILIFSSNLRSFSCNFEKLLAVFEGKVQPDILIFCETWFNLDTTVNIPYYKSFHTIRPGRGRGGGISIYIKDTYNSNFLSQFSFCNSLIEICSVEVKLSSSSILVVGIYRPQGESISNFVEEISTVLSNLNVNRRNTILIGDLNINLLNDSSSNEIFFNCMRTFLFVPAINKPTRFPVISGQNPSLLDQIWTNSPLFNSPGIVSIDITDHMPIFVYFKSAIPDTNDKIKITFRNRNEANHNVFIQKISCFDWNEIKRENVHEFTLNFLETINKIYCETFPLQTKYLTKKRLQKPWLTNEIFNLVKLKSTYFTFLRSNLISVSLNNSLKNKINFAIRKAKSDYYNRTFDLYKSNLRMTWKLINDILSFTKNDKIIKTILFNNTEFIEDIDIANIFNEYFCKIPVALDENIPHSNINPLDYVTRIDASIFFNPVSIDECKKVIKYLKKTNTHIDQMPLELLKANSDIFAPIITDLTNKCFTSGKFPDSLKIACVTPVFKKGDRKIVSNYRPISVSHYLSKIIENLILTRLNNFITEFKIIADDQFGFRAGKSTTDAIVRFLEFLYSAIDHNEFAIALFIDYQKAFDTVNREILLKKLDRYGIRGKPLDLIASYLSNRYQFTKINSSQSSKLPCNIGLPQGAILSPTLFILYLNDLHNLSNNFTTVLFADDTTLLFKNLDFSTLIQSCNHEIDKFRTWTTANRLSLNVDKTCAIVFSNQKHTENFSLYFGNETIKVVTEFKFLGVIIDNHLKFSSHSKFICNKLSKNIGILFKLSCYVPRNILRSVYFSVIYPYLNYCTLVWGNTYYVHLFPIFKLQKRAIRILGGAEFLAHTGPIFRSLGLLKLEDIFNYQALTFVYRNPDVFSNFSYHGYNTRNVSNLYSESRRIVLTSRSVLCFAPNLWNNLPDSLKSSNTLSKFKFELKKFLVARYASI